MIHKDIIQLVNRAVGAGESQATISLHRPKSLEFLGSDKGGFWLFGWSPNASVGIHEITREQLQQLVSQGQQLLAHSDRKQEASA